MIDVNDEPTYPRNFGAREFCERHRGVLESFGFERAEIFVEMIASLPYSISVYRNQGMMFALTSHVEEGSNFRVAPIGSPISAQSIIALEHGWSLITQVWEQFYDRVNLLEAAFEFPAEPALAEKTAAINISLEEFLVRFERGRIDLVPPSRFEADC